MTGHATALRKQFETMARRDHVGTIARRFVDLAYCSVAKPVNLLRADALEAEYLTHARGQEPDDLKGYAELLGMFAKSVVETDGREDVLGAVFGELGVLNAGIGQFFTPVDLCHVMAALTIPDDAAQRHHGERIRISDPACGTGAMVLAAFARCKTLGLAATFVVTDISHMIARAAYLQLCFAGVPAVVQCGDSLRATVNESALTVAEFMYQGFDRFTVARPRQPETPPVYQIGPGEQLGLQFGQEGL